MPVTGIAQYNGDVYAATDFGVLRLPSGSTQWEDAASGMPPVAVYGLTLDRATHTLYAATHGRGAYKLGL
jgi:glucose/arabinose dehydrogenase